MGIIVSENFDSRTSTVGNISTVELRYTVYSDPPAPITDTQARDALMPHIPDAYDPWGQGLFFLPRKTVQMRPISHHMWEAIVTYEQSVAEDVPLLSFDTGGGTQHIVASRETVGRYGPKSSAATGKMIGATKDGVEGVDIVVPVYQFSETHYFKDEDVTPAYKNTLFFLTGKVNSGTFRGFARGECLFLGASGTRRGDGGWEITFKFAASPNEMNLAIGNITGIAKRGWEYLWVTVEDYVDESIPAIIKKPVAVYVERVYEEASFAQLDI